MAEPLHLEYRVDPTALANVGRALADLSEALGRLTVRTDETTAAIRRWLDTPWMRRRALEAEQGYATPDWVWDVLERQRQTFGSGNGRRVRE